jgi:trehalose 6-phosphate phosphatase
MQHLFKAWPEFVRGAKAAHILLLADYDGTLTPIAPRPAEALLPPEVRRNLIILAKKPAFSAGVISGRAIEELKSMVGVAGIYYAGNHGLEIEGPGLSYVNPTAASGRGIIKRLAGQLAEELDKIDGIFLQDKELSISVHYRLVAKGEEGSVEEIVQRLTAVLRKEGKIVLSPGKKVWEIRPPVDWDKGKAVETIVKSIKAKLEKGRLLTIFLGDDVTDEDAFEVVRRPEGWSVYVGPENNSSAAGYFLESPAEVEALLNRLIDLK